MLRTKINDKKFLISLNSLKNLHVKKLSVKSRGKFDKLKLSMNFLPVNIFLEIFLVNWSRKKEFLRNLNETIKSEDL